MKISIKRLIVAFSFMTLQVAYAMFAMTPTVSAAASQPQPDNAAYKYVTQTTQDLGNDGSHVYAPSISYDGRYVAFTSIESTFVSGDTNGSIDVFRKDLQTNTVVRASLDTSGNQLATGVIADPLVMSTNGNYIGFSVIGTNGKKQVYVRSISGNTTYLASTSSSGVISNTDMKLLSISNTGVVLLYGLNSNIATTTSTNNNLFMKNLSSGVATLAPFNDPTGLSHVWSVRGDTALLSGDGSTLVTPAFDTTTNYRNGANQEVPQIVSIKLTNSNAPTLITPSTLTHVGWQSYYFVLSSVSRTGRYIAFFANDSSITGTDTYSNLFLKDTTGGSLKPIDTNPDGSTYYGVANYAGVTIADSGRYVGFESSSSQLDSRFRPTNVGGESTYITDMTTGRNVMIINQISNSWVGGGATNLYAPGNGTFAFTTSDSLDSADSVSGTKDLYIYYNANTTAPQPPSTSFDWASRSSQTLAGAKWHGRWPTLSYDGHYIIYASSSSDIVTGDTNANSDVFRYDTTTGTNQLVSLDPSGNQFSAGIGITDGILVASPNGRYAAFRSVVSGVTNVYVRDIQNGTTTLASSSSSGVASNVTMTPLALSNTGLLLESGINSNIATTTTLNKTLFLKNTTTGSVQTVPFVDPTGNGDQWQIDQPQGSLSADGSTFMVAAFDTTTNVRNGSGNPIYQVVAVNMPNSSAQLATPTTANMPHKNWTQLNFYPAALSSDGSYALFSTNDTTLLSGTGGSSASIYKRDFAAGTLTPVDTPYSAQSDYKSAVISDDGRYVGYASTSCTMDSTYTPVNPQYGYCAYIRDTSLSTTRLVASDIDSFGGAFFSPVKNSFAITTYDYLRSEIVNTGDSLNIFLAY